MPDRFSTLSFLSDYGTADEFVGVVKSVIRSIAPEVVTVDITHDIAPHDVRAGALALARSAQYLCPGVVLAVVDPGVGTARRAIAVEVGGGQSVLIGPDNGLLAPAVAMVGGATRAFELTNAHYHLPAPGATFAGRDVFAPVAAHLCTGVSLDELGTPIDPAGLRPGVLPVTRQEGDTLVAEVLWVDRFGNAQLNVDPDEIAPFGDRVRLRFGDNTRSAQVVAAYDDLSQGEVGLVIDSYGLLEIALDRRSAAAELSIGVGTEVVFSPADDEPRGLSTPVELRSGPPPDPSPNERGRP